ncbi:MAG TPA: hypothetical protein PKW18_01785 [Candidatus Sumerlaeota bacterium]|nr:hypothetical protein [Candidatus Sumerlaeota bacterium]
MRVGGAHPFNIWLKPCVRKKTALFPLAESVKSLWITMAESLSLQKIFIR